MNKQETTQIITLLAGNYESIANKSQIQRQMMLNSWYECLNDLDYKLILQAVKKAMIDSAYPPTIHDIRKNAIEFINPIQNDPLKDWDEAYKMIKNGSYMTQEEFEQHSPACKRFFGSVVQLKAYSTNSEFNLDVTRANFLKQHSNLIERQKEDNLLPDRMKQLINQNLKSVEIKQIASE